MPDIDGYYGTQKPTAGSSEYNAMMFVVRSLMEQNNHVALVKVVNVDAPGGLGLAGTVDVQPLVNQIDGQGRPVPHAVVNGIPYHRLQGGKNGVIIDPQVNDIGLCVFADRDTSSAMVNKDQANPGSLRRNSMSDGFYFGGVLNAIPEQYVMFLETGITIVSPHKITMQAPEIDLVAPVISMQADTSITATTPIFTINGDLHATGKSDLDGDVTSQGLVEAPNVHGTVDVTFGGKSGIGHIHTGGTISGKTGTPV